jgi:hypothetical protein
MMPTHHHLMNWDVICRQDCQQLFVMDMARCIKIEECHLLGYDTM